MTSPPFYLEIYQKLKDALLKKGYIVADFKPILKGCEFQVFVLGNPYAIKMYSSGETIEFDFLGIKDKNLVLFIEETIKDIIELDDDIDQVTVKSNDKTIANIKDHILTCVVGDNCRFGPVVYSGLILNDDLISFFNKEEIYKSSDIKNLDSLIEALVKNDFFTHIVMSAFGFNEIYEQIKQTDHIIAWGQRKLLEKLFEYKITHSVFSNNFGNSYLIYTHFATLERILEFNDIEKMPEKYKFIQIILNVITQHIYLQEIKKINMKINKQLPYFDKNEEEKVFKEIKKEIDKSDYKLFCKLVNF